MRSISDDRRRVALVVVVAAVLVTAVGAVVTGGQSGQPSGDAVLNDTRDRYTNAESLVATADVTVSNDTTNRTATVEFAAASNQSRTVVETDNATYRTGVNETVGWYVGPNRSVAYERDTGTRSGTATPMLDALHNGSLDDRENVSVDYLRSGSDDGTDAHVVEVVHDHGEDRTVATLWIAQSDARLLRVETETGTNRAVIDYRDTRFNTSVHDSTFDPPADRLSITSVTRYDTFDATQANTSLDLPRLNASFYDATVITGASITVAQAYRDEGDNVTVVSTTSDRRFDRTDDNATDVTIDGYNATVTTIRDQAVVYWEDDGVVTAVVVDASEDRAVALARRLDD